MTPATKYTLRVFLGVCACALLLPLSAPAASRTVASTPCWVQLVNEWYTGRITHIYPIPCYQQAIDHLPSKSDLGNYSTVIEDIQRARALAIAYDKNKNGPKPTITTSVQPPAGATGTTGTTGVTGAKGTSGRALGTGIPKILNSGGGATSFPLPLIILGGLAIFLLAAGGVGLIVRRMQGRGGPGTA